MTNKEPQWIDNPMTGECPVPDGHDVEVMFDNGRSVRSDKCHAFKWRKAFGMTIIKYRDWTAFDQEQKVEAIKTKPHYQDSRLYKVVTMFNTLHGLSLTETQVSDFIYILDMVQKNE